MADTEHTSSKNYILLIDDEAVIREIGSEMLDSIGYSCLVAENGETGIQIFKKNKNDIALIILDIEMPGLSGDKVYDMLKEIDPDVKILISSGYARPHLESKYFKRKIDPAWFMPKPFQLSSLSYRLKSIIE